MTTPTQAQKETMLETAGYPIIKTGPAIAPTQAQIEMALNIFNHCMEKAQNRRQAITAAITAAAGVEEQPYLAAHSLGCLEIIEQCIRIVESFRNDNPHQWQIDAIVAAFHTLKDDAKSTAADFEGSNP